MSNVETPINPFWRRVTEQQRTVRVLRPSNTSLNNRQAMRHPLALKVPPMVLAQLLVLLAGILAVDSLAAEPEALAPRGRAEVEAVLAQAPRPDEKAPLR